MGDRNRRTAEQELADVNESLSDATVQNQAIAASMRKFESEMATLHADLDGMTAEAKSCDEKASKTMVDAARLADAQVKDMQTRLDEADMNALKGGKKAMNK